MDLEMAKYDAALYYNLLIDIKKANLRYPVIKERKKAEPKAKQTKAKTPAKKVSSTSKEKVVDKKEKKEVDKQIEKETTEAVKDEN
jgi:hypothetical protein